MSLNSVFASPTLTSADKNRQHIFDDDILHYFLTKIDLSNTERVIFASCLVNRYGMKVTFCSQNSDIELSRVSTERFFHAVDIETV